MGHVTFTARKPRAIHQFFGSDYLVEKLAEATRQAELLQDDNDHLREENEKLRHSAAAWRAAAKVAMDDRLTLSNRLAAVEGRASRAVDRCDSGGND